jgi:hypothetical protein
VLIKLLLNAANNRNYVVEAQDCAQQLLQVRIIIRELVLPNFDKKPKYDLSS